MEFIKVVQLAMNVAPLAPYSIRWSGGMTGHPARIMQMTCMTYMKVAYMCASIHYHRDASFSTNLVKLILDIFVQQRSFLLLLTYFLAVMHTLRNFFEPFFEKLSS